jgi:hypothetical protein
MSEHEELTEEQLTEQINEQHRQVISLLTSTLHAAKQAGELLRIAKNRLAHGDWERWLETNFEGTIRTAQVYMKIAKHWGTVLEAEARRHPDLSIAGALEMLRTAPAKLHRTKQKKWEPRDELITTHALNDTRNNLLKLMKRELDQMPIEELLCFCQAFPDLWRTIRHRMETAITKWWSDPPTMEEVAKMQRQIALLHLKLERKLGLVHDAPISEEEAEQDWRARHEDAGLEYEEVLELA